MPVIDDAPSPRDSPARSYNIQVLRAVAAIGVVLHHVGDSVENYLAPGRYAWDSHLGGYGVDLFFVISGYVMMMTTSRRAIGPWRFIRDRIIRIVPLYWLLTLLACIPLLVGAEIFGNKAFSAEHLARSLFFIPPTSPEQQKYPILFVGWTLNLEMGFYLLFAMALALVKPVRRAAFVAVVLVLVITLRVLTGSSALAFVGRDIILGFALGALLWELVQRAVPSSRMAFVYLLVGFAGLLLLDLTGIGEMENGRLGTSLAAGLIVLGAVALDRRGLTAGPGIPSSLGDASYSLYLIHPFVVQAAGKVAILSGLNLSVAGLAATCAIMVILSIAAGLLLHRWFERPAIAWLKDWSGTSKALKSFVREGFRPT